jgi:hypothetical protein
MATIWGATVVGGWIAGIGSLTTAISLIPTALGLAGLAVKGFLLTMGGWPIVIAAVVAAVVFLKDSLKGLSGAYDQEIGSIQTAATNERLLRDRFVNTAKAAKLSGEEIRALSTKYKDIESGGKRYNAMLKDLLTTHSDLRKGLQESSMASTGFTVAVQESGEKIKLTAEQLKIHNELLLEFAVAEDMRNDSLKEDAELTAKVTGYVEDLSNIYLDIADSIMQTQEAQDNYTYSVDAFDKMIEEERIAALKAADANGKMGESFSKMDYYSNIFVGAVGDVIDMLESLGYQSTNVTSGLAKFGEGLIDLGASMESNNIGGEIQGIVKIIGGLIEAIFGAGESFEELNARLQKEKQYAKELSLSLENLADTIDNLNNMTPKGFQEYAKALNDLIDLADQAQSDMSNNNEFESWLLNFGNAFTSLINKAKELGTEGSAELIKTFEDLKARGIEVKEVAEYIAAELQAGLEGYMKMKNAMKESKDAAEVFKDLNIQVYEEMIAYQNKVAANKGLTDAIDGATQALIHLSNTQKLTQDQFGQFEKVAVSSYDKLIKQGFSSKEALQQLAPMLARLKFLHDQYGYSIDDATQKLMDQAKENGVNINQSMTQEEAYNSMADSLKQLVKIFGGDLPNSVDKSTAAFKKLQDASKFGGTTPPVPVPGGGDGGGEYGGGEGGGGGGGGGGHPHVTAAAGFYSSRLSTDTIIHAHKGEEVLVTPAAQNVLGGGKSSLTNITITVNGSVTPEIVADAITTAYNNNTRGLRSTLQGN